MVKGKALLRGKIAKRFFKTSMPRYKMVYSPFFWMNILNKDPPYTNLILYSLEGKWSSDIN